MKNAFANAGFEFASRGRRAQVIAQIAFALGAIDYAKDNKERAKHYWKATQHILENQGESLANAKRYVTRGKRLATALENRCRNSLPAALEQGAEQGVKAIFDAIGKPDSLTAIDDFIDAVKRANEQAEVEKHKLEAKRQSEAFEQAVGDVNNATDKLEKLQESGADKAEIAKAQAEIAKLEAQAKQIQAKQLAAEYAATKLEAKHAKANAPKAEKPKTDKGLSVQRVVAAIAKTQSRDILERIMSACSDRLAELEEAQAEQQKQA